MEATYRNKNRLIDRNGVEKNLYDLRQIFEWITIKYTKCYVLGPEIHFMY